MTHTRYCCATSSWCYMLVALETEICTVESPNTSIQSLPFALVCTFFNGPINSDQGYYFDTFQSTRISECALLGSSDNKTMPIIINTSTFRSLTPTQSDFVKVTLVESNIKGVGATAKIKGTGQV